MHGSSSKLRIILVEFRGDLVFALSHILLLSRSVAVINTSILMGVRIILVYYIYTSLQIPDLPYKVNVVSSPNLPAPYVNYPLV